MVLLSVTAYIQSCLPQSAKDCRIIVMRSVILRSGHFKWPLQRELAPRTAS